jgi:predicted GH43/DUF377 family glycosyl hydrolase
MIDMKWNKMDLIVKPEFNLDWMVTHAQLPFAEHVKDDIFRLYFAGRNKRNMSSIGHVEIDIKKPDVILHITDKPILGLGALGTFDDSGVFPTHLIQYRGTKYLYYVGFMQGKRVRWYSGLGLALSDDGGETFKRVSRAPILERNKIDPYLTASCSVLIEDGLWRMWYTSGTAWKALDKDDSVWPPNVMPYYHIRYAESENGIDWKRKGIVCIDFKYEGETRIAHPCVIKEDGIYKMWYSYATDNYMIGYAESENGIDWIRKDEEVEIGTSKTGWDSEMIGYPFVFEHDGKKYMLYNGNSFGKDGIGLAIGAEND